MSFLSRLFGGKGRPDAPPRPQKVGTIRFAMNAPHNVRRVTYVQLVRPGHYRVALTIAGSEAYAPKGRHAPLPDGGWSHAVHMVCCAPPYPLQAGEQDHANTITHRLFQNRADPGPHPDKRAARNAFRAIAEEDLSFELTCDTRLIFWIEADGEAVRGDGVMELDLLRID